MEITFFIHDGAGTPVTSYTNHYQIPTDWHSAWASIQRESPDFEKWPVTVSKTRTSMVDHPEEISYATVVEDIKGCSLDTLKGHHPGISVDPLRSAQIPAEGEHYNGAGTP